MLKAYYSVFLVLVFLGFFDTCQPLSLKATKFFLGIQGADSSVVNFYVNGNVKDASSKKETDQETASGAIGASYARKNLAVNLELNNISSFDAVNSKYAKIILNPSYGNKFNSGFGELYLYDITNKVELGFHGYFSIANSEWAFHDSTKSATVVGSGLLLTRNVFKTQPSLKEIFISVDVEGGIAYRVVSGDISNYKAFYKDIIGTDGNQFWGVEGGFAIKVGNITGALKGYWLRNIVNKDRVDGVTSLQMTTEITISGSILEIVSKWSR